jgi:hypothetical protein
MALSFLFSMNGLAWHSGGIFFMQMPTFQHISDFWEKAVIGQPSLSI